MSMRKLEILIPTFNRPAALAVTLTSLYFQSFMDFDIIISDQGEEKVVESSEEISSLLNAFSIKGVNIKVFKNLPRKGMAQQRQFLLDQSSAPFVLYLDDDLILESFMVKELIETIVYENCGFVGTGTIGLSYMNDVRPHEQEIEIWKEKVKPEIVAPHLPSWKRHKLHNAANLYHLQERLKLTPTHPVKYKVAWASACVLYDRIKLIKSGGFTFWESLPADHCGEDVTAQLNVMKLYGGCGVAPSGVYHQELATTIPDRSFNIPEKFGMHSNS